MRIKVLLFIAFMLAAANLLAQNGLTNTMRNVTTLPASCSAATATTPAQTVILNSTQLCSCSATNTWSCMVDSTSTQANIAGQKTFTTGISAKTINGVVKCDQFATPGVTPFQTVIANCIAALPASGPGVADASNVSDATNTLMTGTLTISRGATTILFPCILGFIDQSTFSINITGGTNGVVERGCNGWGGDSTGTSHGTYFVYRGTGTAHAMGDSSATSFAHVAEDFSIDLSVASGSAVGLSSTRVYDAEFNRLRGSCPAAANTMTFMKIDGTSTAPGGQTGVVRAPMEYNCQFGIVTTGGTSPPLANGYQYIGGAFSGNGAAGSIAFDIEAGADHQFFGPYIGNYDTGLKVASPSPLAVWGNIHMESCGTQGILFATGSWQNEIWTDSSCAMTYTDVRNTVHLPAVDTTTNQRKATVADTGSISTTETVVAQSGTITSNRWRPGDVIHVHYAGTDTTTNASTSTFTLRIGSAGTTADGAVFTAVTAAAATTGTSIPFEGDVTCTVRTIGAAATASCVFDLHNQGTTGIATTAVQIIMPTMSTFNTTTAGLIVSLTYKTSNSGTTSIFKQGVVEIR